MGLRHCACGVLIKDGQILLGKRSPERKLYPNAWDMIGGHQEAGETLDETLVREFEEEIAVTPTGYREVTSWPSRGRRTTASAPITSTPSTSGAAREPICAATSTPPSNGLQSATPSASTSP